MTDTCKALHDGLHEDLQRAIQAYAMARRVKAPVLAYDIDFRDVSTFLSQDVPPTGSGDYLRWVQDNAKHTATVWRICDNCQSYIAAYNGDRFWRQILGWPKG